MCRRWAFSFGLLVLALCSPINAAEPPVGPGGGSSRTPPPPAVTGVPPSLSCGDRGVTDPASDKLNSWVENKARLAILQKVRQGGEERGEIKSLLALEIGLAGSYNIYNSIWLVETPSGVTSFTLETPEMEGSLPVFGERTIDPAGYALLWTELEDLRLWTTPSDSKTVNLRADVPVFTGTFCRDGRLHRIRIENPPLPTWGKDDSFEQARRRHDKKAREFMLRPRDRGIEVMRLIQAF
jgi:hypothetical protein